MSFLLFCNDFVKGLLVRRIGAIITEEEWKNHKVSNFIINDIQEMMNNTRIRAGKPLIKVINFIITLLIIIHIYYSFYDQHHFQFY